MSNVIADFVDSGRFSRDPSAAVANPQQHRAVRFPLLIVCICCGMVRNTPNFRSADYSTCVVHTKTIIHLSVSVKVVDIYLAALQLGKYQPLSDLHFDE